MSELPLCSCGKEPVRALGQRYGKACHALAAKKYRAGVIVVPRVPRVTSLRQAFDILQAADMVAAEKKRRRFRR